LMEKISALNMGVTEALIGLDSPDIISIVAEDLKFHIDRFQSEVKAEEKAKVNAKE